ncbi:MAG: hypothetical protein PHT48_08755 [Dechloromonas sp.]|nr:hypothetical protein [Dechloromonas sp.]
MSSSLNSRIVKLVAPGAPAEGALDRPRRQCLQALLVLPWLAGAGQAMAAAPLAGLQRWGEGRYRRYGFHLYDAVLWASEQPAQPPWALELTYGRRIAGARIVAASLDEMAALGADPAALPAWGKRLAELLPDVNQGDRLLGVYRDGAADFYFNAYPRGRLADAEFARYFFGIWLDPRTSAPELRAALLRRPPS